VRIDGPGMPLCVPQVLFCCPARYLTRPLAIPFFEVSRCWKCERFTAHAVIAMCAIQLIHN
jgi:hypothetical protein